MGFVMDGLEAEAYDRSYTDRQLIGQIVRFFKPRAGAMGLVSVMVVLNALMDTLIPILVAFGIDRFATGFDTRTALLMVGGLALSGVFSWTFNFIRQWYSARIVGDVVLTLRQDAFGAVMERDMSFFDQFVSGKIVSRITSDTQDFATVVTLSLNLVSQLLLIVLITGYLFYVNPRLTLLALSFAPVVIGVALGFRRIARQTTRSAQRARAQVNASVQETINGISIAKNFRQEQNIYDAFVDVNDATYGVNIREGFVYGGLFPTLVFVSGIGTIAVAYFGGLSVLNDGTSAGDWFLFLQAIGIFWFPLTSIASFWSQFQQGLSASERVFALIDADPRVVQTDNQQVTHLKGDITFKDVAFSYTDKETVLHDFDLHVPAGETIALVGHTGAGKSSLGKLVARFYEYQDGQLRIDDKDIRTFNLQSYRQHIGVVPQTPFLFNGTVADNIRYSKPDATDAEVEAVSKQIGWGEWIDILPEGLASDVGEGGRRLSMGQRQLVALARVMLQQPSIVILDEATASIDPVTEAQIQDSLDVVLQDRTAIVIAHRLSTIVGADRIIVLENGKIIESGDHAMLMQASGHYAELYDTYFRHQSAAAIEAPSWLEA